MIETLSEHGAEIDSLAAAGSADERVWVRVTDATSEDLDRVAEAFGIHPLAVEDLSEVARTKTEEYPDYTFVLLKIVELAPARRRPRGSATRAFENPVAPGEGC